MPTSKSASKKTIKAEGHLIDSMILTKIFDEIMDNGGDFEVQEFQIGKRKTDHSHVTMTVSGNDPAHLERILKILYRLGATSTDEVDAAVAPAEEDRVLPADFYSTSNYPTAVRISGEWVEVDNLIMDKVIVVNKARKKARCKPIAQVRKGDSVVVGDAGIQVRLPARPREGSGIFNFMTSGTSSEKPSTSIIRRIAEEIVSSKKKGQKIVVVAGPAVVHTRSGSSLARMISLGYIDTLLAGNALAVHDVEYALFGTSLGVDLESGISVSGGNRNHIAAINQVYKAGSLRALVEKGLLRKGIIYECIGRGVPFALAGSIRDDGPLPEVIVDTTNAQKEYRALLKGTDLCIMMATMLHSIAVGNLLPSSVRTICIDINPLALTKLMDRGTVQAIGVISDIGVFLPLLVQEIERIQEDGVPPHSSRLATQP